MENKKGSSKPERTRQLPKDSLGELHQLARTQVNLIDQRRSRWKWSIGIVLAMAGFALISIGFAAHLSQGNAETLARQDDPAGAATTAMSDTATIQNTSQAESLDTGTESSLPGDSPDVTPGNPTALAQISNDSIASVMFGNHLFVPLVSNAPIACLRGEDIRFEIVTGPQLDPPLGTTIKTTGSAEAQASWTIRNSSNCQWESLRLYSISKGLSRNPTLIRNGSILEQKEGLFISSSGDFLTLSVTFRGDDAEKTTDEWILVINGFQLFSQPHLTLNVSKWVVVQRPVEQNQVKDSTTENQPGGTGSTLDKPPPEEPPPPRSTPSPPQR
jgi:hypothetical protein